MRALRERAAGARTSVAPVAPGVDFPRPEPRGRRVSAQMRRIHASLLLAFLFPAIGLCAPVRVPAGKMFRGEMLDIRAPASEGWVLAESTPGGWSFAREGRGSRESYVASVLAFSLAETRNSEEFVELIKSGIEQDTSPDRFGATEATLEYTEARGYPCVKYQATTEDKGAKSSLSSRAPQKLQVYSLYCRHPKRPTLGFAIIFSHRGSELDPNLEQLGEDFAGGVQVPPDVVPPSPDDKKGDT